MLIFLKGKKMAEDKKNIEHCCGECCHCKKIFMMLVVLILVFMSGVMVGNCGRCHYADSHLYNTPQFIQKFSHPKHKKLHRGMHEIPPTTPTNATVPNPPSEQLGGFIIEVDQTN